MKITTAVLAAAAGLATAVGAMAQPISYTGGTYQQNFDSLPATGTNLTWTNGVTIPGWYAFCKNGTGSTGFSVRDASPWVALSIPPAPTNTLFNAGTGSGTSGGLYTFGLDGNPNRTLGSLGSGTPDDISYGMALVNNSAATITEFTLTYTGRQWRAAVGNSLTDVSRLEFDYKITSDPFDGTELAAASDNSAPLDPTWTRVTQLDFVAPVPAGAVTGALVGTDAPNFTNISHTVTGVSWAPGQILYVRWFDCDDPGANGDNAMGLDDLSFSTPSVTNQPNLSLSVTDSPDPLQVVGGQLTYTITVNNLGLVAANGATVTAPFPPGVSFVSSSVGGTTFNANTLSIPLGNVPAQSTGTPITVVMQPNVAFPSGSPLSVTFTANPTAGDSDPANNVRTENTVVDNAANLGVTMSVDAATCNVPLDTIVTWTIDVTNAGPATAQNVTLNDPLPANMQFNGLSSVTQGSLSQINNIVVWNAGNLASGATATLTLKATVLGPGAISNTASVVSITPDFALANNTATVVSNVPDAGDPVTALHTSVPGSVTAAITVPFGGLPIAAEFAGNSFAFGRPFASPSGNRWVLVADTNLAAGENTIVLAGNGPDRYVVARESVTDQFGPGETTGTADPIFDRMLGVNDDGKVAFSTRTNNADANARRVTVRATPGPLPTDPYSFAIVSRQSTDTAISASVDYAANASIAGIAANGALSFYSNLQGSVTGTTNTALFTANGTTVLHRAGATTVPAGQAGGGTDFVESFQDNFSGRGFSISPEGEYTYEGTLNNVPGTSNAVLVVDGAVVAQEGSVLPGSGMLSGIQFFNFNFMENDGNWFAHGSNLDGQDWIARNGAVIAKTGQPIFPGSTEVWSDVFISRTFFLATGRGETYVVGGATSNTALARRVIVANGTTVVLREGDPVDVNDDGIANDNAYVDLMQDYRGTIIHDKSGNYLIVVVNLRSDAICDGVDTIGQALLKIELPPAGPTACNAADIATAGNPDPNAGPDGFLTGDDFDLFISAFFNETRRTSDNTLIADLVDGGTGLPPPDNFLTGADFDYFISQFFAGC